MLFIYIALSLLLIIMSCLIFKKKINPFSVYATIWMILIGLYASKIIKYNPINKSTWYVFFIVIVVFFIGSVIGYYIAGGNRQKRIKIKKSIKKNEGIRKDIKLKKTLELLITALSLISFLVAIYSLIRLIQAYGFNIISNIGTIYDDNINGNVIVQSPRILLLNHIAIVLSGYYISKFGVKKILILPIINAIIDQLLSGSRGMLVIDLMFFVGPIVFFGFKNKKSRNAFIALFLSIIFFFILITVFRSKNKTELPYASDFLKALCSGSRLPYSIVSYLTLPLAAFNEFMAEPFSWEFGQSTFRLFYKLFSDIDVERIDTFVYATPIVTNVYTYLGNLYADFGFAGIIVGPLLLSTVFSFSYFKLRVRKTVALICLFDTLFVITMMSFFSWYFAYMYVVIVLIFGIIAFLFKKFILLFSKKRHSNRRKVYIKSLD